MKRGRNSGLKKNNRPRYNQATEALRRMLMETEPGTYLPSEPKLARQLGVSRATLREAMRTFEGEGLIVRRQGVGTLVTSPPQVIESGLETLESIDHLAERIGLDVETADICIQEVPPTEEEQRQFGLAPEGAVVEISRVMFTDQRPIAYLVDTLPEGIVPAGVYTSGFRGSVLDLLLSGEEVEIGHSHTEVTAISSSPEVSRKLGIQRGDVLMCFEGWLHTRDGRVIDHSLSYFLPGIFRFHIVRRVRAHS